MNKRTYRSKNVNQINWVQINARITGEAVVLGVDIAKEKQFALLSDNGTVSEMIRWDHPQQTAELLSKLRELKCSITVVMESTGTYGDALRYQFRKEGYDVFQASAKRVHDACEVFDGVPSLHDAKAATLITKLHREGLTLPWHELSEQERELRALCREYDMYQGQYQRNQNRLEAYLSRHWPEVSYLLALDSVTLESLLLEYGSPARIAMDAKEAACKMKRWGGTFLKREKIDLVIDSAIHTLGQPCIEAERCYLQSLAKEMRHSRLEQKSAKKALEAIVQQDAGLKAMGKVIGKVTTAVLVSCHLDPRNYKCPKAYQKSMGLNLKEKSSGRHVGQLKITKRGSSTARKYLYFAAMRLIQKDPIIKVWYEKKRFLG